MLRQQELCRVSMLRWSPVQSADEMPPYDLVCTLVWRSPTEFWIEGMRGEVRPEYIREWADWLREHGITKVYAHRAPGHRLPLFRDVGEHLELSVDRFVKKFGSSQASGSPKPSAMISIVSGSTPSC